MSNNQFDAPNNVDVIDNHLEKFFSDKEIVVMHEIMSETVHSDVFIKPNKRAGRNYTAVRSMPQIITRTAGRRLEGRSIIKRIAEMITFRACQN
jgi:protoheme ferro-lyase